MERYRIVWPDGAELVRATSDSAVVKAAQVLRGGSAPVRIECGRERRKVAFAQVGAPAEPVAAVAEEAKPARARKGD